MAEHCLVALSGGYALLGGSIRWLRIVGWLYQVAEHCLVALSGG